MIDAQAALNTIMLIAVGAMGWFARELWTTIKELKNDLVMMRIDMATRYVNKAENREDIGEIKLMLDKIFSKLESKADKQSHMN
jgi:hypothetical protein